MNKNKFDLGALLNEQSTIAARSPGMRVTMLHRVDLLDNPENKIYRIGDVSQLAEDIAANGIRQPLEVVPSGDKYLLIGGHRRLAACVQLAQQGDDRFESVPCIVHPSKGAAMDKLDLITANATARELTDGERLDQYIAMKDALEQLKKEGKLEGRVRDEMARRLGESTGSLGRLNAIAANATEEVKQAIRDGNCGFIRAYEASKLHPCQQMAYVRTGKVPVTPQLDEAQKATKTEKGCRERNLKNPEMSNMLVKTERTVHETYRLTARDAHRVEEVYQLNSSLSYERVIRSLDESGEIDLFAFCIDDDIYNRCDFPEITEVQYGKA